MFQRINLSRFFKEDLTGNEAVKQAIAGKIIDLIVERTQAGKDANGGRLKSPYSDAYASSLDFKAWGKSKNKVNMELTGGMMGSLEVIDSTGNEIIIGWTDKTENAKAYNHNKGITVPKREFFGVSDSEFKEKIASDFVGILGEADSIFALRQNEMAQLLGGIQKPNLPAFDLGDTEDV